jgi:hypothetical protein
MIGMDATNCSATLDLRSSESQLFRRIAGDASSRKSGKVVAANRPSGRSPSGQEARLRCSTQRPMRSTFSFADYLCAEALLASDRVQIQVVPGIDEIAPTAENTSVVRAVRSDAVQHKLVTRPAVD